METKPYVTVKVESDGVVRNFENSECFDILAPYSDKIVKAFQNIGIELKEIWFDIGISTYNLHIETIADEHGDDICDYYYKVENGKLIENYMFKDSLFSELKALNQDEEFELCTEILKYKSMKGGK